jgi:hypothetical protein
MLSCTNVMTPSPVGDAVLLAFCAFVCAQLHQTLFLPIDVIPRVLVDRSLEGAVELGVCTLMGFVVRWGRVHGCDVC